MDIFLSGRIYAYETSYSSAEEDINSDRIAIKYTKIEKQPGCLMKSVLPNSSATFDKIYSTKGATDTYKVTLGLNEKDSLLGYGYTVYSERCWLYTNVKYIVKEDVELQLEDGTMITDKKIIYSQKMDGESLGKVEDDGEYELFGYIDGNDFVKLDSNVSERDENGIPISFVWIRIDSSQILELEN